MGPLIRRATFLFIAFQILLLAAQASIFYEEKDLNLWSKALQMQESMMLMFPNRTGFAQAPSVPHEHDRKLSLAQIGQRPPYKRLSSCPDTIDCEDPKCLCVRCVKCSNLEQCSSLNGFIVQETYYPDPGSTYTAKCEVIENLAKRVSTELFGKGRTFRDTEQCRDIVMQYLCLFYGSHNPMYTNYCIYQEDYVPKTGNPKDRLIAARPPCRSFCVQVVTVCANEPDLLGTCGEIACPNAVDDLPNDHWLYDPTRIQDCAPDPRLGNEVLNQLLFCDIPWEKNPYFKAAGSSHRVRQSMAASLALSTVLAVSVLAMAWV